MACQMPVVQLANFIAILQLLAGLCLLFFYEDLLKRVAVTPARTGCIAKLENLKYQLQVEFSNDDLTGLYNILDCRYENGEWVTIHSLRNAISYIGKLAFVYLIALMIVASHEAVGADSGICYSWLLLSALTFFLLIVWSLKHRNDSQYERYWNFLISAFILCSIIVPTAFIPWEIPIDKTLATYLIILTIPAAVVLIVIFFKIDERRATLLDSELENLGKVMNSYRNWAVSPNDKERFNNIDPSLRRRLNPDASQTDAELKVKEYVTNQVHELKKSYSGPAAVLRDLHKGFKTFCHGKLRLYAAGTFGVMLILLYLTELVQLARETD